MRFNDDDDEERIELSRDERACIAYLGYLKIIGYNFRSFDASAASYSFFESDAIAVARTELQTVGNSPYMLSLGIADNLAMARVAYIGRAVLAFEFVRRSVRLGDSLRDECGKVAAYGNEHGIPVVFNDVVELVQEILIEYVVPHVCRPKAGTGDQKKK